MKIRKVTWNDPTCGRVLAHDRHVFWMRDIEWLCPGHPEDGPMVIAQPLTHPLAKFLSESNADAE